VPDSFGRVQFDSTYQRSKISIFKFIAVYFAPSSMQRYRYLSSEESLNKFVVRFIIASRYRMKLSSMTQ
jgi:hypothetical protein